MSNSLKGLILAAGIIVTCTVIALGFYIARASKDTATTGVNQISKLNSEFQESDKIMYDGLEVAGSEVLNVINKFKNDEVAVIVQTKKSTSYYIYTLGTDNALSTAVSSSVLAAKNVKSVSYINPNAQFLGTILRDKNNAITGISFTQE